MYTENLSLNDDDEELDIQLNMMIAKMGDVWQPGQGLTIEEAHPNLED
ncbi:hypothetical protein A2U01_0021170 [Trifolium medium]|uniref:Uncharacterized protein n=1 Tax=Trifolium medium TaxID=97028 RepID=A0A392NK09_9FABA|nr:hypothetical protein [Trifolium medium]